MRHPADVIVGQVDATQPFEIRKRFRRQLGDEILLQTTVKRDKGGGGETRIINHFFTNETRVCVGEKGVGGWVMRGRRERLHFGGVVGQRQRHGGEAFLATVDDAVVTAARMRTLADGAALHLRVLGQACDGFLVEGRRVLWH